MALPAIAGIALEIGLPVLTAIFERKGSASSIVASRTLVALAEVLGVEPTEKAIIDKFEAAPEEVTTVFRQVEEDMAEIAEAAADATKSYHDILKDDRDSPSILNRIWRPFNGLVFGCEVALIVGVVSAKILDGDVATLNALQPLYAFLGTILGTHAGVVGVYVWRRSDEKLRSKA